LPWKSEWLRLEDETRNTTLDIPQYTRRLQDINSRKQKNEESAEQKKEKELRDKKIDDAIKKAWEEK
jgi:hypothetical protein